MKTRSKASLRREQERQSPKTIEFKNKINNLLENADEKIAYSIKRDLAIMTSMPFYKDRPQVIKVKRNSIELIYGYAELFMKCEDTIFITKLIKNLARNQGQTIRKAAPKIGEKKDVWEHAIPAKIIINEILVMVQKKDLTGLQRLLEIYQLAGQRGVTKVQDKLLKEYRHSMPAGWNWKDENIDPLARHKKVGITYS